MDALTPQTPALPFGKRHGWAIACFLCVAAALVYAAYWTALGFQHFPVGDDDAWAYYFANFSLSHLTDYADPIFHRPRYVLDFVAMAANRFAPNTDLPFVYLLVIAYGLVVLSTALLGWKNTSPLVTIVGLFFLLNNGTFTQMTFIRSAFIHCPCSSSATLFGLICALHAEKRCEGMGARAAWVGLGALFLLAGAMCRESIYLALVVYVFYHVVRATERWTQRIPRIWKWGLLGGGFLFLFGCILLVPFVRWFTLDFLTGKNARMKLSIIADHSSYIFRFCMFPLVTMSLFAALQGFRGSRVFGKALAVVLLVGSTALVAVAARSWRMNLWLGYVSIAWFFGVGLYLACALRRSGESLVLGVALVILAPVLVFLGDENYFLEAQVFTNAVAMLMLHRLLVALAPEGESKAARPYLGILLTAFLVVIAASQLREVRAHQRLSLAMAEEQGGIMADLNATTQWYYRNGDKVRPWEFVLIPAMAQDSYNSLFYGNPTVGVLAFRLGHTKKNHLPAYADTDFVIPFPYGKVGRYCLVRKTARIQTISRSVDTFLRKGQILFGARLSSDDPKNLYAHGNPIEATDSSSSSARKIPVRAGRLYMCGATFRSQANAREQTVTLRVSPVAASGGSAWTHEATLPGDGEELVVFGYFRPEADGEVIFDPQPPQHEPNAGNDAKSTALSFSRAFFVDVTIPK
jgi:hypothetical protein